MVTSVPFGPRSRFTASSAVFDMGNIAFLFHKLMHIIVIVTTVQADVLFTVRWVGARDHNRDDQVVSRPLIMAVGAGNENGQRCTAFVNQQVDFAAAFPSIRRVLARLLAAQRGRTALAVNRLPLPFDRTFLGVELDHDAHDSVKDTQSLPGLETFMQRATADPKPLAVHCFPLTAGPQHIPDAIQRGMVVGAWSPWSALLRWLGQHFSDLAPQGARHMEEIDIFRFLGRVLTHGVSRFRWVDSTPVLHEMRPFFTLHSIYG